MSPKKRGLRRILITGSRNYSDSKRMRSVFEKFFEKYGAEDDLVLVSGNARGADSLAEDIFESFGYRVERHPANWNELGKRAGFVRNAEMVNLGADVCVAFPLGESRGTFHCVNLAKKAGIPVLVVPEV